MVCRGLLKGVRGTHVDRVADPVDARVVANNLVHGIDHDDLVVLVNGILKETINARGQNRRRQRS